MVVSAARSGPSVVGREAELFEVAAFLDERPVAPAALVVEGDAGIGKTTIVRAALERAQHAGLRVLIARPAAGEAELPFAGLGDLLAGVGDDAVGALAAPQREAIDAAVGRSDGAVNEYALSRGVLELLRTWAVGGDVLLVVDDAQWLDRPTSAALAFALRRLGSVPLRALIAVRRANGAAAEPPLGVAEWEMLRRLVLGPMSATELGAVLRNRLGEQLPRPRLEALHQASGGNPMFALELARQGNGWPVAGATLTGAVAERLRTLDPEAWRTVSYAAAALRPSADLLVQGGVSRAELRMALASGVLEAEGDRLRFAHPLLGSVAYELLLVDERREIHARLAEVAVDTVERGHHLARSATGASDAVAEALAGAAETAAGRGDHAGAATLLLRAAELSPDGEGDAASLWKLSAAGELELAGDVEAAAVLCRRLIDHLPAGVLRARARQRRVSIGMGMSYDEGLAELELALNEAADDVATQIELHCEMSAIGCGTCRLEHALAHARIAIELAERAGATTTVVDGLCILGFAESMLGLGVTDAARQAFARWDGTIGALNSPRMNLACACLAATEFDEAETLFIDEIARAQELGLEPIEVVARGHLAETQTRAGRWVDALANARLALEHAQQASEQQVITATSAIFATIEALLGRHAEARIHSRQSLAEAEAIDDFWWMVAPRAVLGLLELTEGGSQAAVDVLEPAWELMLERGLGDLSIFPVAQVLGEALVAVGRPDDALAVAERLRGCPVGEQPWCRMMASRLEALVASARGDDAAARSALESALEACAELPEPFEWARTLHIKGRVERRARNWGAARAAFVEALERFDILGAARWAENTTADIARLPGRRPADTQALTTREREIAELAASGLTNREVAARLFVSPSTVEANLSKVYAKLGVRSRTELAGRLNRPAGT
jgi:DNA-binding CsgD family transcriptional regulator